ncbi:hypothetical protein EP7_003164 [Isosphaeraceae bacterium EP7]
MRRSLVVCLAILPLVGMLRHTSVQASPADREFIEVKIQGKLLVGEGGSEGRAGSPVITANGISFTLEFKKDPPTPARLTTLHNHRVVVRGTLKKGEKDQLICVVEGDVNEDKPAGPVTQYLVGYRDGQQSTLADLGQSLGMKVVDRNVPGKFLILETTDKTEAEFFEKLKKDKSVRFVEKNLEYKIPEK